MSCNDHIFKVQRRPEAAGALAISFCIGLVAIDLQGCGTARRPAFLRDPHGFCSSLEVETVDGLIRISTARVGELVDVICPAGREYHGPRLECSWVDKACISTNKSYTDEKICWHEYNLTYEGAGLTAWPQGVDPKLVSQAPPWLQNSTARPRRRLLTETSANFIGNTRTPPSNFVGSLKAPSKDFYGNSTRGNPAGKRKFFSWLGRNTTGLPHVVTAEYMPCRQAPVVDLDFANAKVVRNKPPFQGEHTWGVRYRTVAKLHGVPVDLVVKRPERSGEPPGDPSKDGKGSAMGKISISQAFDNVTLRFQFVKSQTDEPIALPRFFFTLFDIDDGLNGTNNKEVTVSGISEYFISDRTQLRVTKLEERRSFMFSADDDNSRLGISSITNMWTASLHRTVALLFKNVSWFQLQVRALASGGHDQDLEFAGKAEIVDFGKRVIVPPREADLLKTTADYKMLGKPNFVAALEGNSVADSYVTSLKECEDKCRHSGDCHSFSFCARAPGWCHLKDKVFVGAEPTRYHGLCSSYYEYEMHEQELIAKFGKALNSTRYVGLHEEVQLVGFVRRSFGGLVTIAGLVAVVSIATWLVMATLHRNTPRSARLELVRMMQVESNPCE